MIIHISNKIIQITITINKLNKLLINTSKLINKNTNKINKFKNYMDQVVIKLKIQ